MKSGFRTIYLCLLVWFGSGTHTFCAASEPLELLWFYTEGCYKCAEVRQAVARVEQKYAPDVRVQRLEITSLDNYKRMMALEKKHGISKAKPMEVFLGDRFLLGHEQILKGLDGMVAAALADRPDEAVVVQVTEPVPVAALPTNQVQVITDEDVRRRLNVWLVAGAGLTDGINPCAFATIDFLVSVLSAGGLRRRALLRAGLAFSAGVFLCYLAMGVGAFDGIYHLAGFPLIASAVYWGIAAGVFLLGLLSLADAWRYRRTGSSRGTMLKMGRSSQGRAHRLIRAAMGSGWLEGACFLAGVGVSVLEVVCTGQIYLPTIMVLAQNAPTRVAGVSYLLLYNAVFIVPLLLVVLVHAWGVGVQRFVAFSKQAFVPAKILLAGFFFLLSGLLVWLRLSVNEGA